MAEPRIQIEGFEIFEVLGHGGMGTVYRARQEFFDREVALKVVQPHLSSDTDFTARFRSEMKHAARIDHPNVVPVYAAGESDGSLYIAMKLIRGENLAKRLKNAGRLPPEAAVEIVSQIAAALDEAHEEGFVHRDIKPANILLEEESDRAYLSDFGIAKSLEATQSLTATGHGVGTIKYVAPEQIQNDGLDLRADVYSLGCVLFEALTGSLPFDGGSDAAILYAKINDETRVPSEIDPGLGSFDQALAGALARNPEDRFGSAGELTAAVRTALTGVGLADAETRIAPMSKETVALPVPLPERSRTEPRHEVPPHRPASRPGPRPENAPQRTQRLRAAVGGAVVVCALLVIGLLISQGDDGSGGDASNGPSQSAGVDTAGSGEKPATPAGDDAAADPAPATADPAPATPTEFATVPESRMLFETEVPEGWIPGQVDQPNAGRFTNTWVSPEDDRVSVLIDSQPTTEEEPSAIASAESVRAQTSETEGYAELAFEEIELNGIPAARWVFDLGAERKVDYFFYDCGVGVAVLGAAPKTDFATYKEAFANVAESTRTNCQSTETAGNSDKPKKDKKDKEKDDD